MLFAVLDFSIEARGVNLIPALSFGIPGALILPPRSATWYERRRYMRPQHPLGRYIQCHRCNWLHTQQKLVRHPTSKVAKSTVIRLWKVCTLSDLVWQCTVRDSALLDLAHSFLAWQTFIFTPNLYHSQRSSWQEWPLAIFHAAESV